MALIALVVARLVTLPLYPLIDSSEGRYSLIPLVMVQTGNWVTPSLSADFPYLAKPALSFWLTAISFSALGVSEFTARLPILLLFIGLGALIYAMSVAERGRTFALGAAAVFATMGYIFFLSGSVMPDCTFTFAVTLALVSFWKALSTGSRVWGYALFVGAAAALLTKGPVGGA